VTRIASRLDAWIHGFLPVTAEGLAVSRILYASLFLVGGLPTFSWVSANPPGFFYPPPLSVAAWFTRFPDARVLYVLDISICVLLVFLLTGFKTRASSVLLTVALLIGYSFRFSFGKIDHNILLVVMPGILAFAGWDACFSIDARDRAGPRAVHAWPVTLLALLVGFGFLSAGLPKLTTWVDFDLSTQGVRSWVFNSWSMGRRRLLLPYFMTVGNGYFWETLDLMAVIFEVGFFFSLAHRTAFRTFLFLAVMFHLMNLFMVNITFPGHIRLYAVFLPWEQVIQRLPRRVTRMLEAVGSFRAMALLLGLFLPLYLLLDRVPVDTAFASFSHLGILAGATGAVDYPWAWALSLWLIGAAATLVVAGLPQRCSHVPEELLARGRRVVFFDGVCNLCNGLVDFLVRHDDRHHLRFASLQSEIGQCVARVARPDGSTPALSTIYLVDAEGYVYERSDAILKILISLGGYFRLSSPLWLVPRMVRDAVYRVVSKSRYRIFGKRESCRLPTPEERAQFI
jgi:predicted DCC family thiol-disulfide oxidoreductase YuxK